MCRGADQSTDNRADCRRAERNPSGVTAVMMDVVNDMVTRWWRWAMRTMPPVMWRGNRRASRQNHASHENRNCLDDLVHITPTFLDFLSLHLGKESSPLESDKTFAPPRSPFLIGTTRPYLGRARTPAAPRYVFSP